MTYLELIYHAFQLLKKNDMNEEVAYELFFGLNPKIKNKLEFAKHRDLKIVDLDFIKKYQISLEDFVLNKKPLSRILGYGYFNNIKFNIFDGVFSFRKETELIIDLANKITNDHDWINNVLDACCGTGVLGLSYKISNSLKNVDLIDINPKAIDNTLYNQKQNNIKNINVINDSIFNFININQKKYDLLLCNPPYIKKKYKLEDQVLLYDPLNALYDFENEDGISFYIFLIKNIKKYMNKKYFLIFEIGFDQYEILKNFLDNNHFNNYLFLKDYNNLWRYLIISSEGLWKYIDSRN